MYYLKFSLFFLTLIISCEYKKFKGSSENFKNPTRLSKEEVDGLSFQKIMDEVIDPYCLTCHRGGKKGVSLLTNYQEVLANINDIKRMVFVDGSMPKNKTMPSRARSLLFAWIESGSPEIGKNPPEPKLPLLPQFSNIRDRIFNVRCGNCHNPQSQECLSLNSPDYKYGGEVKSPEEGGYSKTSCHIELSLYDELLFGKDEEKPKELVLPGDPENSQLLFEISKIEEEAPKMPPAEFGFSPLSDEEVQVIREWIRQGALNN